MTSVHCKVCGIAGGGPYIWLEYPRSPCRKENIVSYMIVYKKKTNWWLKNKTAILITKP